MQSESVCCLIRRPERGEPIWAVIPSIRNQKLGVFTFSECEGLNLYLVVAASFYFQLYWNGFTGMYDLVRQTALTFLIWVAFSLLSRLVLNLWEHLLALLLYKQRGLHSPQGFYTYCHFPMGVKLAFPGAFDFRHANNMDSKDLRWQTVLPLMYSIVAFM